MAFDNFTFDEGISPGGMRSRDEIRILICYLLNAVKRPVRKDIIIDALQKKALANYFESSSCFDDLVKHKNIEKTQTGEFKLTNDGKLIANQLENNLSHTAKEKAFLCVMSLMEQEKNDRDNTVKITKTDNGYTVKCTISGGEVELYSFCLYVPDYAQAKLVKKNFKKNPEIIYQSMLSLLTKDKRLAVNALSDIEKLS
ncbi:MAG: DUF4364 family protein [Ruminococcus sp.]|nr:DUF4364 family protein [Ruminococcus sp.]